MTTAEIRRCLRLITCFDLVGRHALASLGLTGKRNPGIGYAWPVRAEMENNGGGRQYLQLKEKYRPEETFLYKRDFRWIASCTQDVAPDIDEHYNRMATSGEPQYALLPAYNYSFSQFIHVY